MTKKLFIFKSGTATFTALIFYYFLFRMHLFNESLKNEGTSVHKQKDDTEEPRFVSKFGFHATTCCGFIPQNNEWKDNWVVSIFKFISHCTFL